jgi:hypothetical protein
MRRALFLFVSAATAAGALVTAQPAAAAVSNDTAGTATVIASVPFSQTVDTTSATTDATDAALNANCGAPATNASVWYAYTAPADGALLIDVSQSSYSAGVITATGSPGSLTLQDCGPGTVASAVSAGQTLYIMAFSDQVGSSGGTLKITVDNAPPPPDLAVTVNGTGTVDRYGVATISGSMTCSGGDFVDLEVDLTQAVGRFSISGSGYTEVPCANQKWSVQVAAYNGKFAGGKSASATFSFACGAVFCSDTFTSQKVQLRKG